MSLKWNDEIATMRHISDKQHLTVSKILSLRADFAHSYARMDNRGNKNMSNKLTFRFENFHS